MTQSMTTGQAASGEAALQRILAAATWLHPHSKLIDTLDQIQRSRELEAWMRQRGSQVVLMDGQEMYSFGPEGRETISDERMVSTLAEVHPDHSEEGAPQSFSATADQISNWAEAAAKELDQREISNFERVLEEISMHLR